MFFFWPIEEAGGQEDQAHDPRGTFGRWSHCRGVGNAGDFADQIGRWAATSSDGLGAGWMCELIGKRACTSGYICIYTYSTKHEIATSQKKPATVYIYIYASFLFSHSPSLVYTYMHASCILSRSQVRAICNAKIIIE